MGSLSSLLSNPDDSYILGLWGADKYHRSSSVGLSNTNVALILKYSDFLLSRFSVDRLRLRVYGNRVPEKLKDFKTNFCKGSKNVQTAYHIYVNSRPLLREFIESLENRANLNLNSIYPYFAGRFDGDGSIGKGRRRFCRIAYSSVHDLSKDRILLSDIKTSVYEYKQAGTFCLYFSEATLDLFLERIRKYSFSGKLL